MHEDIFINNIFNIASRWDADTLNSEDAMIEILDEVARHAAAQKGVQRTVANVRHIDQIWCQCDDCKRGREMGLRPRP